MPAPAVVAALMESFGSLKGASDSITDQFTGLANKMRPFIEAFSPSQVQAMNAAMRDLHAVIGMGHLHRQSCAPTRPIAS